MGFFSPRSTKKKKVVLAELLSSSKTVPCAAAPPPLFQNENNGCERRQLLKNLKGSGPTIRRNSINSDSSLVGKLTTENNDDVGNSDGQNGSSTTSTTKSFHQSFTIRSPSRIRAIPLVSTTTSQPLSSSDPFHLSPSTGHGSLTSLKSPGVDTNNNIKANKSVGNENNSNKSITLAPLTSSGTTNHDRQHTDEHTPQQKQQLILSPPLYHSESALSTDGSLASYIEEVIEEEVDENGFDNHDNYNNNGIILDTSEDYEYIEEIVLEDNNNNQVDIDGRKRVVKFDEFDEVQVTLHLNDFTEKEIGKYWYHREDYDGMIEVARSIVQKEEERQQQQQIEVSTPMNNTTSTAIPSGPMRNSMTEFETRGLEAWSTLGKQHVRQLKEAAIEAVWDEQHRQWDAGVVDGEMMRSVYERVSIDAQRVATERGTSDQIIVEKIRQLDELAGRSIDQPGGVDFHKRRLKKTTPRRPSHNSARKRESLLTKSRSLFGKKSMDTDSASTSAGSSRNLLLQSISRTANRKASERKQRVIYKQPSASARVLIDAGALSSSNSRDDDGT
jgi:hypothetical protein